MAAEGHEFSGKTVEEATQEGLSQLGLTAAQAEIEVLSRGSRGIFGIGSEPARVRIVSRAASGKQPAAPQSAESTTEQTAAHAAQSAGTPASDSQADTQETSSPDTLQAENAETVQAEAAQSEQERVESAPSVAPPAAGAPTGDVASQADTATASATAEDALAADAQADMPKAEVSEEELSVLAQEMLSELVRHMGFECSITADWRDPADDESDRYLHLDIHGTDLGALIGRRGETLAGLQYLVRLMINQRIRQWKPIIVDVENYKERRNNQLTQLALRMAEQVVDSGRAMSLEPMPANERRIIHLTLRDHPQVYTQSSGEGERRKVHIVVKEE